MSEKSVLITGAAGFIGSHLVERFLNNGFAVMGVDNFLTGRESNLASFINHDKFRFEKANVISKSDFPNPFGGNYSYVLHFACPASPVDFAGLPVEILEVDSKGTLNTLQLAREHQATYVMASTSEVYGDPLEHPQRESYWGNVSCVGPRSCYDEAKRFSEAAVMSFRRKFQLDTRIVRIFNTYGPRMRLDDGRVVPNLCKQALESKPLTIHGKGLQTRSFCFVDDLVEAIYLVSQSKEQDPINIGNPHEYTIMQFVEILEELFGQSLQVEHIAERPDDPRRRRPDITRAKEILHWQPSTDIREGLQKTIAAFRAELSDC